MSRLYIVSQLLSVVPDYYQAQDKLLLVEEGVYLLQNLPFMQACIQRVEKIYILTEDAVARGVKVTETAVQAIDYAGYVTLCATHPRLGQQ